ncbi:phage tail protein [Angustibacter sp. McL0619]|uniref:phage tail protein n=1 Tax=Angustibacter sp. McL0619 TaxID=3415676 RepID=UPI003CE95390
MRRDLDGSPTPHPLAPTLPAVLAEDLLVQQLCAGLDVVLSPVITTLDSLSAYLDPQTAPADMVAWLGHWIGLAIDQGLPEPAQRDLLVSGIDLIAARGTPRGVRAGVQAVFGVEPDLFETGSSVWSTESDLGELSPETPQMLVRLQLPADHEPVDTAQLDALVEELKPAHVAHAVEVVQLGGDDPQA